MSGFIDRFNKVTKSAHYQLMDDAIWIKPGSGSKEIKTAFSSEALNDELGNISNIQQPLASCFINDVEGICANDVLAVQGQQYKIVDTLPEGDGMINLILRKL